VHHPSTGFVPQLQASNMTSTPEHSKPAHVKTRFIIISDTHSSSPTQNVSNHNVAFRPPLPKADVLLHCGDLTMVGYLHEYEKTLDMLESIEADLKLVIAGNHDISLDEDYYARKGQFVHRWNGYDVDMPRKAKEMWMGERARKAGVTYLEEGTYSFTLKNGATLRVRVCSDCLCTCFDQN
jgi:predicted phosphodiesterase